MAVCHDLGELRDRYAAATSSFLNETSYQLEQLVGDQTALAGSLADYRTMLQEHIAWARKTDQKQADGFRSIHRRLDEMGW